MAYKKLKYWFDEELAIMLGSKVKSIKSDFAKDDFVNQVKQGVSSLELKDRVEFIADQLYQHLQTTYVDSLLILSKILGPENENETGMFKEFYWVMPVAKYVEKYGLENFEESMEAIKEITKRNTGEYAIRPYIKAYPDQTIARLQEWSKNPNAHVRRLSSEGVRPRLPWAKKLDIFIEDPSPIFPILNNLRDDQSKYVQKSVANCINDVLKDNPEKGKNLVNSWTTGKVTNQRKWIIRHSLRNLLKEENRWAQEVTNSFE